MPGSESLARTRCRGGVEEPASVTAPCAPHWNSSQKRSEVAWNSLTSPQRGHGGSGRSHECNCRRHGASRMSCSKSTFGREVEERIEARRGARRAVAHCAGVSRITVEGLMTRLRSADSGKMRVRTSGGFANPRPAGARARIGLPRLSYGHERRLEVGARGATWVRLGTVLFGERRR